MGFSGTSSDGALFTKSHRAPSFGAFAPREDVAHSTGTFPTLRVVSLDYLGWLQERGVRKARISSQLERMSTRACEEREVMEWIASAEKHPQLR